ncbi:MAG: stage 0 sporulation protein [Christensenellaceae bacterium]|jgi:cell fate regulator YaaT (PSP1 superfamily)|nr:stage 0 sporulation protein [Christensenellaceae bacterium]
MQVIVGVKFRTGQRVYYFDPKDIELNAHDNVIVETQKGVEFGTVVFGNKEIPKNKLQQELKQILRKATADDIKKNQSNLESRPQLLQTAKEMVSVQNLPIKIVDVEYNFDRKKIIVFFTSHNNARVDFRNFTKDFATLHKTKVEMRQIYERDDIRMRGNVGLCGRTCCCITHLQNYDKVNVKMAKIQNLPINPSKLGGCCGKLMCCLSYEYETYKKTLKSMPRLNSYVKTPEFEGRIVGYNLIAEEVKVKVKRDDQARQICKCHLSQIKCCETPIGDELSRDELSNDSVELDDLESGLEEEFDINDVNHDE